MAVRTGMRGNDLQRFLMVARELKVILLVRHTNADSLRYVSLPGYYPKPAVVKAKTANVDRPVTATLENGRPERRADEVVGLVVHPGFRPTCYLGSTAVKGDGNWCYIHGDSDLKDVIVRGHETDNRRHEGKRAGVQNFTPMLSDREFERRGAVLDPRLGAGMVRLGADAPCVWHGDEPLTVAFPDFTHLTPSDAATAPSWYERLNRDVRHP